MAADAREFAVQLLRDQIGGQHVYPVHRLDRKTSGVLLFAKTKTANQDVQQLFRDRKVQKVYVALVRGFMDTKGQIDYAITYNDKVQDAQTDYELLKKYELDIPFGKFDTSRYSLVMLRPHTGRFHQLRKHMAHIFHPIIGDRPHGCNKQNKLWKDQFQMSTMLLHAERIRLEYPDNNVLTIYAGKQSEFKRTLNILDNLSKIEVE